MRVVQLSTTDVMGGAALAAHRLHEALPAQGVTSELFVAQAAGHGPHVHPYRIIPGAPDAVNHFLFRVARRCQRRIRLDDSTLFTLDWTTLRGLPLCQLPPADVHHLHWFADFLDFRSLPRLAQIAPLVWTFHDMNAFTGGCHYDEGCGRFTGHCGACPVLASSDPEDVTSRVIRRKARALGKISASRLIVVTPSEWLASEVRRSPLFERFATRVIPNGIDLQVFQPVDREAVRRRLGFTPEDRVVLFAADRLSVVRKGWSLLLQALAPLLDQPDIRVLTIGEGETNTLSGPRHHHLGRLDDSAAICETFNAADVFVVPSLQDNFPNTVLESLAAGTPVAGFATGGIVDAVEQGVSGLLAPTGDVASLTQCIQTILNDDALRAGMRTAARARAVACYSVARQAQAYRALYEELLSDAAPPGLREQPSSASSLT